MLTAAVTLGRPVLRSCTFEWHRQLSALSLQALVQQILEDGQAGAQRRVSLTHGGYAEWLLPYRCSGYAVCLRTAAVISVVVILCSCSAAS